MRLLNAHTGEFEEFFDSDTPRYVVLSHRWEGKEMSFQDFQDLQGVERYDHPGFAKIQACCSLALRRKREWVWIDTCCIDKKSSAELTEAINSMWHWYEDAEECYAYLSDVTWMTPGLCNAVHSPTWKATMMSFRNSVWFTRGWTLQELLAPREVLFFDSEWNPLGTKNDLKSEVSAATNIGAGGAYDLEFPRMASVATKLSWASKRETSRLEDKAYCLLGIFGVNMPLLYGEGIKAFTRLQLEVIKKSDDESIFAWNSTQGLGMLAPSPGCFTESWVAKKELVNLNGRPPYAMTNKGLALCIRRDECDDSGSMIEVRLDCYVYHTNIEEAKDSNVPNRHPQAIMIRLKKNRGRWQRCDFAKLLLCKYVGNPEDPWKPDDTTTIYVRQDDL